MARRSRQCYHESATPAEDAFVSRITLQQVGVATGLTVVSAASVVATLGLCALAYQGWFLVWAREHNRRRALSCGQSFR